MHELSLAHSVVDILCEEGRRHQLEAITSFRLEVGVLRAVVPDLLRTCLGYASKGTLVESATVIIDEVAGKARCNACNCEFTVDDLLFLCPECGQVGGKILAGEELRVVDLEGE